MPRMRMKKDKKPLYKLLEFKTKIMEFGVEKLAMLIMKIGEQRKD